jgi:hypothetical protein
LGQPAVINPQLTGLGVRKGINGGNDTIFNDVLARAQVPPGIGVGGNTHSHRKDGNKNYSDQ